MPLRWRSVAGGNLTDESASRPTDIDFPAPALNEETGVVSSLDSSDANSLENASFQWDSSWDSTGGGGGGGGEGSGGGGGDDQDDDGALLLWEEVRYVESGKRIVQKRAMMFHDLRGEA